VNEYTSVTSVMCAHSLVLRFVSTNVFVFYLNTIVRGFPHFRKTQGQDIRNICFSRILSGHHSIISHLHSKQINTCSWNTIVKRM